MQIIVNTDSHITGGDALSRYVETTVQDALERYGRRITRVEIHFRDESSAVKSVGDDKHCLLEVRLARKQPITASACAPTVSDALSGALRKIESVLERTFDKRKRR